MARYLVTGGAGFIGSHVSEHLLGAGHEVIVLDNLSNGTRANLWPAVDFVEGDIRDGALVARLMGRVAGVIHLAAIASVQAYLDDWTDCHAINLNGSAVVFDAAARAGVPVVYASSAAVYGDVAALPLREDGSTAPTSFYGQDKLSCELYARIAQHAQGLRSAGLRYFNVYGPRQAPGSPYSGVISKFVDRLAAGAPVTLFGDGGQTRDFVFVGDVARATIAALHHLEQQPQDAALVLNVCTGTSTSVKVLAERIAAAVGRPCVMTSAPPRDGDIRHSQGSTTRLETVLGVIPATPLSDGLAQTIAQAMDQPRAAVR